MSQQDIDNDEHQAMIDYCLNILKVAPENSVEHKIAAIALAKIQAVRNDVAEMCKNIIERSNKDSIENKIANIVLAENLSAITQNNAPDGWILVPIEPTNAMFGFIPAMSRMKINEDEYDYNDHNKNNAKWIYRQMLSRSPNNK